MTIHALPHETANGLDEIEVQVDEAAARRENILRWARCLADELRRAEDRGHLVSVGNVRTPVSGVVIVPEPGVEQQLLFAAAERARQHPDGYVGVYRLGDLQPTLISLGPGDPPMNMDPDEFAIRYQIVVYAPTRLIRDW